MLRAERRDVVKGQGLRKWLEQHVMPAFAPRFLPVNARIARRAAALHVPDPMPERDALIAATALIHGMVVVTRNEVDFARAGVPFFNPWPRPPAPPATPAAR